LNFLFVLFDGTFQGAFGILFDVGRKRGGNAGNDFAIKRFQSYLWAMFTEQQEKWLKRVEELFFKLGIKSITMDDVARELGISKKTLYAFVESKDDLVSKVMDRHITAQCSIDELVHAASTDAVDEMVRVIRQIMAEVGQMKPNVVHEMQKYHREVWERVNDFQQGYILNMARQNMEWGRRDGLYRTDFDIEIAARFYIAGAMSIFDERYFPKPPYSFDSLFKEFIINYLYSIVSEKGAKVLKEKLQTRTDL
jgi:AcrR family transcriptional regulator